MAVLPHLRKGMKDLKTELGVGGITLVLCVVCFLLFILAGCLWVWWWVIKAIWSVVIFCFDTLAAFAGSNPTTFGAFLLLLLTAVIGVSLAIWFVLSTKHTERNPDLSLDSCQTRVWDWLHRCFGMATAKSREERTARFLEEALE